MELWLIAVIVLLLIGFLVALASGGVPGRGRRRAGRRVPPVEPDPGAGRPAGPGAEAQHPDAGTLHPPSQSPEPGGEPDAVPPFRARGTSEPGEAGNGRSSSGRPE